MKKKLAMLALSLSTLPLLAVQNAFADDAATASQDVDLALHQPYTVSTSITDTSYHKTETTSFPDDGTKLTDGVVPPNTWGTKGPWVGYLRQDRHVVEVDLGDVQTLHKLDAYFLQDTGSGIYFPDQVTFAVSDNGTAWDTVGSNSAAFPVSDKTKRVQDYTIQGLNVTGRYVRYIFYTQAWSFLGEVQAWGIPGTQQAAKMVPTPPDTQPNAHYPLAGSKAAGGKKNEVLIPSGYYPTPGIGTWHTSDFVPYVGYVDATGHIEDYMFDSFQFDPFSTGPSKGTYGGPGTANQSDWQYFVDQLFQSGVQLEALNQAVGQVESVLPNKGYQAQVVIGIPYPGTGSKWGSGLDFNANDVGADQALANRLAAVHWYVNYVLDKWNLAHYQNLKLSGFYWINEKVPAYTASEDALVKGTSDIVHATGSYTFDWIPYNESEGFRNWQTDGFDTAQMQPNYAFNATADAARLTNTAELSNHYGLGIEMEMHWYINRTDSLGVWARNNYTAYLDAAVDDHYQNSFLSWYQNTQSLLQCEQSTNPDIRNVYDETYQFIKGNYQPSYRPGPGNTGSINMNPVDITPHNNYQDNPSPHDGADTMGAVEVSWADGSQPATQ